ncbi:MAG: Ig-like domain-containing protein [Clostridia bacterium]|nr:Ig-like domain-containing protein [Clostridia bacterium]
MKRLVAVLLCVMLMSGCVTATAGYMELMKQFPDMNLLNLVILLYDTDNDGELSKKEIKAADTLLIEANSGITDLSGIEIFTNMECLLIFDDGISKINLTKFPKLRVLSVNSKKMKKLDISKNPILVQLMREYPNPVRENGFITYSDGKDYGSYMCVKDGIQLITGEASSPLMKSMKLNKTKATLKKGKTLQLKVKSVKPSSASKAVTWVSDNTGVATVDKNGKVKAVGKGSCTITCTAADGSGVTATCVIKVK